MIRLLSFSLGNQGYLSFMGNQFGHPEWIDFPREGNNWSYHYCRRRWDLAEQKDLKYHFLLEFDRLMIHLDTKYSILGESFQYVRTTHEADQILIYQRGGLLFVFNFNPTKSFQQYPNSSSSAIEHSQQDPHSSISPSEIKFPPDLPYTDQKVQKGIQMYLQ